MKKLGFLEFSGPRIFLNAMFCLGMFCPGILFHGKYMDSPDNILNGIPENQISEVLGALSDPELSGSGKKTSGIYPIFRTYVVPLIFTL